jgi:putative heme-binding domain-containing protein
MITPRAMRYAPALLSAVVVLTGLTGSQVADAQAPKTESQKRPAWTTSRITGSPEKPLPYTTERAFPALTLDRCLDMAAVPGSDRFFVVSERGAIWSFPNRADVATADPVLDVVKDIPGATRVYAIAFHPDFQKNRFCYVCYIEKDDRENGSHIARFKVSDTDPPTIDPDSETTIITWRSGGHNGCCLKFGPDGCLYISTGDGSGPNPPDSLRAGQDVSNLLSAILRIDVDHPEAGRNYRIPSDNPFVDLNGARGEIWAYGLRNPWRMSFDRQTGDLWVGDVGWELWELLYRVERGGNYGWSVMEGRQATNPEWPRGPTPILPPTIDHPHSESSSITDGLTYYGSRLKELHGHHLYGDYDTGKIWGFRYENGKVVDHRELADTTHRIVGFGEDHTGEFYILDHTAGTIHRLIPNPQPDRSATFPRKLSETGLFSSIDTLAPAAGVVPFSINAEAWADYAIAERLVGVPGDLTIRTTAPSWTYPPDTVLVKTLSLEMEHGNPATRHRIETQVLHFDGLEWQAYAYQWNDDQSDAVLLDSAGGEQTFDIADAGVPGGKRRQVWRFSGRAECQRCHNKWSGPPLAFNTFQLNRNLPNLPSTGAGASVAQLDLFAAIGLLDKPVPEAQRQKLTDPHDVSADLDSRARAYLHTNCAHCHRLHAGSAVLSKMQFDLPLAKTDMVGVRPTQGTFNIHAAQVIAPADPFRSVLLYRMAKIGGGRMPHIGSTEVDRAGVELIYHWLQQIPKQASQETTGDETAARLRAEESDALRRLRSAKLAQDRTELVTRLLSSASGALMLLWAVDHRDVPAEVSALAIGAAARHADVSVRDLFERFLPPEQRVKRLGTVVQPEKILALAGDASRGRKLFHETASIQCKNCHRIQNDGKEVGPDLSAIGKKYAPAQILENLLEPSKVIEPRYVTYLVETTQGRLISGLLVKKDEKEIVLKDAQNMEVRIPANEIEQFVPQRQSLMPELLLRDMTAEQVADLLAYLSSLK